MNITNVKSEFNCACIDGFRKNIENGYAQMCEKINKKINY